MVIDNYLKNQHIVSYDANKTWIREIDGKLFFFKKTNKKECIDQIKMKELLTDKTLTISNKVYKIDCPSVYSIEDGVMSMEYFDGINLELLLKDKETHKKGVIYLNELIKFFITNKIYWLDFAPRNILISDNLIMIVDYEKGIMDSESLLEEYLRNHVYEEYNLFLIDDERILNDVSVFDTKVNINIEVDLIESPRYKCIAKLLGYDKIISYQEYLNILKIIIEVEKPYYKNEELVFPGVILDNLIYANLNNDPIELYSKEVIKLNKKSSS